MTIIHPIHHLVKYYPYWTTDHLGQKIQNPKFNDHGKLMLDVKSPNSPKHLRAVAQFADMMSKSLSYPGSTLVTAPVTVVVVPSSGAMKWSTGLCTLAQFLIKRHPNIRDGQRALQRIRSIQKLATGGDRRIEVHLGSLDLDPAYTRLIAGQVVLVIDDVASTGNSLDACSTILLQANAAEVHPVALGRTAE